MYYLSIFDIELSCYLFDICFGMDIYLFVKIKFIFRFLVRSLVGKYYYGLKCVYFDCKVFYLLV